MSFRISDFRQFYRSKFSHDALDYVEDRLVEILRKHGQSLETLQQWLKKPVGIRFPPGETWCDDLAVLETVQMMVQKKLHKLDRYPIIDRQTMLQQTLQALLDNQLKIILSTECCGSNNTICTSDETFRDYFDLLNFSSQSQNRSFWIDQDFYQWKMSCTCCPIKNENRLPFQLSIEGQDSFYEWKFSLMSFDRFDNQMMLSFDSENFLLKDLSMSMIMHIALFSQWRGITPLEYIELYKVHCLQNTNINRVETSTVEELINRLQQLPKKTIVVTKDYSPMTTTLFSDQVMIHSKYGYPGSIYPNIVNKESVSILKVEE